MVSSFIKMHADISSPVVGPVKRSRYGMKSTVTDSVQVLVIKVHEKLML